MSSFRLRPLARSNCTHLDGVIGIIIKWIGVGCSGMAVQFRSFIIKTGCLFFQHTLIVMGLCEWCVNELSLR